ncbi:hypothetical protein Tco_0268513 [Tanacetum coccineum]
MLYAYDCYVSDMRFGRTYYVDLTVWNLLCGTYCMELTVWIFYVGLDGVAMLESNLLHAFTVILHNFVLRALADLKSILYGSYLERSCIETLFKLKHSGDCYLDTSIIPCVGNLVIMSSRMTTRSASRSTAVLRGGRMGGQTGVEANEGVDGVPDISTIIAQQLQNILLAILAQVGNQGNNQGNNRYQNGNAVNDNIEKIESVQDMSGCGDDQKVKYTTGSFVSKALTWWNS